MARNKDVTSKRTASIDRMRGEVTQIAREEGTSRARGRRGVRARRRLTRIANRKGYVRNALGFYVRQPSGGTITNSP